MSAKMADRESDSRFSLSVAADNLDSTILFTIVPAHFVDQLLSKTEGSLF